MKGAVGQRSLIFLDGGEWESREGGVGNGTEAEASGATKHLMSLDEKVPNKQELSHQTNEEAIEVMWW